jgi:hypothetical protein
MQNNQEKTVFPSYLSKWIVLPFMIVLWFSVIFIPFSIVLYLCTFSNGFSSSISDFGHSSPKIFLSSTTKP